jgi:hypothetical protein
MHLPYIPYFNAKFVSQLEIFSGKIQNNILRHFPKYYLPTPLSYQEIGKSKKVPFYLPFISLPVNHIHLYTPLSLSVIHVIFDAEFEKNTFSY